jgi:hypothetical protein
VIAEVSVKKILFVMSIATLLVVAGCGRDESVATGTEATGTFKPPEPKPGELGTDAMTQTVELDDGRSENEGGHITTPDPDVRTSGSPVPPTETTATATTTTTTTTTTTNPPPPRKP